MPDDTTSALAVEASDRSEITSTTTVAASPVGLATLPTPRRRSAPTRPAPPVAGWDGPEDFPTMWLMAESLAKASILPSHFHEEPGNVFAVMCQARAADIPTFVALQHMNVIDGRVEESAELVRAMLIRAGYTYTFPVITDTECVIRLSGPGLDTVDTRFSLVEAQQMGLAHKKNWRENPQAMLVARATTRAVSRHLPHITMGLGNLSHAELGDDVPEALGHLREPDPVLEDAAAVWEQAQKATTVEQVKALGAQARADDLLDVSVAGISLNLRLIGRLDELKKQPASVIIDSEAVEKVEPSAEAMPCGCDPEQVLSTGDHAPTCALRAGD